MSTRPLPCIYRNHPIAFKSPEESIVFKVQGSISTNRCDWYLNGNWVESRQSPILDLPLILETHFGKYEAFYCDVNGMLNHEVFGLERPHPERPHPLRIAPYQPARQNRDSIPRQIQPFNPSLLQPHEVSYCTPQPPQLPHPYSAQIDAQPGILSFH